MCAKIIICLISLVAIIMAQENNYKPGEILMFFKSGIVTLVPGDQKGGIEVIQGSGVLKNYLNSLGFQKLIKSVPDFSPADTIAILDDGTTVKIQDFSRLFKIIVTPGTDILLVCDSLKSFPEIIIAEPNYLLYINAQPNDPKFSQQWNLDQISDCDIDMKQAWDIEKGNYNIKIGILDLGVQYQHEDFGNGFGLGYKVKGGWDYVHNDPYPEGDYGSSFFPHGNHVAGIASALTNNNKGVSGISGGWGDSDLGCAVYAYQIGYANDGSIDVEYAINAILRASKPTYQGGDGVHILNCSWGTYAFINQIRSAVITAYKYGRTFVAAKGNDNTSALQYPSDYDQHCVLSVGATDKDDQRWYNPNTGEGSNYGNGIDVVAPGVDIWSTKWFEEELYVEATGTSMAAPHVSGLAGLILSRAYEKNVSLQPEDLEGIIRATAEDKGAPGYDDEYGAGRINAYDALRYFDTPNSIRRYTLYATNWTYCGTYPLWLIGLPNLDDNQYQVEIWEVRSSWFSIPTDMIQFLGIWGLGRLTAGYSFLYQQVRHYGEGWCAIEKSASDQYRTKTYVYNVWSLDWQHNYGWFPTSPGNVIFRYSLFSVNVVPPYNLRVENITQTSLTLKWNYNYPELIDGYTVKKDGIVIGNPESEQTQWSVTGLEPGHMYHFEVLARKGSIYSAPAVLDAGTVPIGAIAQSNCAIMSAFNSNCKVVRCTDGKIHTVYYDGIDVFYSLSTDGGATFAPWQFIDHGDTIPALAIDANGTLWLVNARHDYPNQYTRRLEYYLYEKSAGGWSISYDEVYQKTFPASGSNANAVLHPPSFTIVGNAGYIAFQEPGVEEYNLYVSEFPLSLNTCYTATLIAVYGCYPSIGYDGGSRIVTLVYDPSYSYGPITLYYRSLGNNTWSSQEVLPYSDYDGAFGAPSLSAGTNIIKFTVEGVCNNGQISGLLYRRLTWPAGGNSYVLGPIELVNSDADFSPNGTEGFSYSTVNDVVMWRYQDDTWYSRRMGGVWTSKTNISTTIGNLSSYPQGIVYGSLTTSKLFALWTEQVGNQYYLVRKVINLPYAYPVYAVGNSDIPEATGYNNAQRFLKESKGILHLAFTSGGNVYHTFLQDTSWSQPICLGEGKYPTLAGGPDGKLHCTWSFHGYKKFGGLMYYVEYLYLSSYNGVVWSEPGILFHTYGTFLWGVGAPSMAIDDTTAYVVFKSYHGPFPNPAPGTQPPQIVVVEGPALIYGTFSLNNPVFSCTILDSIIKTQTPVDTLTYRDSLVPLLISPSVTVDMAGIPHILWEGDSTMIRYYTITGTGITRDTFDAGVDFPHLAMNGDKVDLFWTAKDSIRYRYGWTGTTNLSQAQTIAECESPFSSSQYLTWTKSTTQNGGGLSHLYYGAIPASGAVEPVELNYSTDRILFPQIVFNSAKNNVSPSLDFVWTEYSELDSLGYIYCLNLPLTEAASKYAFDMGTETPVPVCIQRDGYLTYGSEDYQTIDYDSTELVYQLTLHSPHKKYKIRWTYYHQESEKLKLGFSIDDILHHNRWVEPNERVVEETWIPQACFDDNAITIRIKKLNGTIAVLSGMEIEEEEVGGGGGPQGNESQLVKSFLFENMYPNPAKKVLKIRFNSPDERRVAIKIYDVAGRLAQQVFEGKAKAGMNEFLIKPRNFAAGVYFVRVETEGFSRTQKIVLLK